MESVFVVQHVYERDGADDVKFIGVYDSEEAAEAAVEQLRIQPGFAETSQGFYVDRYELNQTHWLEGFIL